MLGIIGLILGTAVLAVGAYKGYKALPLAITASLVVAITNGMNIWHAFGTNFMRGYGEAALGGYISFFMNFFLIFAFSALFAKVMEETGSAMTIGYKFIDWLGVKSAVLIVFVAGAVLTYGGISLFVVIFALTPIIMVLFNEANIPRALAVGPVVAGTATFTMKSLPGSPQATNIAPTGFLGTDLMAAPLFGIISAILMFAAQYAYFKWEEKRLREKGESFSFIPGTNIEKYQIDRNELPGAAISFLPMIVVLVMIIVLSALNRNANIGFDWPVWGIVVTSMIVASALAIALNWQQIKTIEKLKEIINMGADGAIAAIAAPAAVVAFGAVVQHTQAFQDIVAWLLGMDMHPYLMAAFPPSIIAGITGSSSGGLLIAMNALAPYYNELIEAGYATADMMHRISSTFAGTLDTLPHSPGLFLMFGYLGITHKEGYRYVWWGSVVIPTIIGIGMLLIVMAMG